MKRRYLSYLFVLIVISLTTQEKEQHLFLVGYVKNLHEFSFVDQLDQLQWTTLIHNRLNFKYTPSDDI